MVKCFLSYSSSSVKSSLLIFLAEQSKDMRPCKFFRDAVYAAQIIIICISFCLPHPLIKAKTNRLLYGRTLHCIFRGLYWQWSSNVLRLSPAAIRAFSFLLSLVPYQVSAASRIPWCLFGAWLSTGLSDLVFIKIHYGAF